MCAICTVECQLKCMCTICTVELQLKCMCAVCTVDVQLKCMCAICTVECWLKCMCTICTVEFQLKCMCAVCTVEFQFQYWSSLLIVCYFDRYTIELKHGDFTWTIKKRYKHIQHLHQQLKLFRASLNIPFPTRAHRERRNSFRMSHIRSKHKDKTKGALPRYVFYFLSNQPGNQWIKWQFNLQIVVFSFVVWISEECIISSVWVEGSRNRVSQVMQNDWWLNLLT
jgi:hypothetical protein